MSGPEEHLNSLNVLNLNDISHSTSLIKAICYGLKDEKHSKQIISFINKQLSSAITRDKGLEILSMVLYDCSSKILEENCITWTSFCMSHHPNETVPALRFKVANQLLNLCNKNQDFNKAITGNLLGKIIETCVSVVVKSNIANYSLKCLTLCLKTYSSTCIVYKNKVEAFLIKFMDSAVTHDVLENAATCFHYLNQVGGAGPSGSTHMKNFNDNFEKMCNTLNNLYEELFKDVNEFENYSTVTDNVHEFRVLASNLPSCDITRIMSRRLRNITIFITKMLECSFPINKWFNPNNLLIVLRRGLSVHVHTDISDLNKSLDSFILQEHQIDLLHLLKALISCLKHNFIHLSSIKIILDCLVRTEACDCFKNNCEYQITLYEVLKYWILNSGEPIESKLYDKIIKHILSDITPLKTSVILHITNTNKSSKGKSKAIQDKIIKSGDEDKSVLNIKSQQNIEQICYEALTTLELLFKKIPLTINENVCTLLFGTMVQILLNISVHIHEVPYTNQNCRIALYKAFIAIFDQTVSTLDIALTINILNLGVHSNNTEISNICQDGITQLEKICQPTHPTLYINFGSKLGNEVETQSKRKEIEEDNQDMEMIEFGEIDVPKVIDPCDMPVEDDANITPVLKENGNVSTQNGSLCEEYDEGEEMEPLVVEESVHSPQELHDNTCEEPEEVFVNDTIGKYKLVDKVSVSDNIDAISPKRMKMDETKAEVVDKNLLDSFVDEVNDY